MMYSATDSAVLAYPTEPLRTADLPKRIDLRGLAAIVEHHPGHTATDLIVRVSERDLVFAGDLLFYRAYPVALNADMVSWQNVLDRFSAARK
jgi:glyoxylase-like metal-dependent hydrolase (beta-lactamase superfamily II)